MPSRFSVVESTSLSGLLISAGTWTHDAPTVNDAAPEPAFSASSTMSAYVPICARKLARPGDVRSARSVRDRRTRIGSSGSARVPDPVVGRGIAMPGRLREEARLDVELEQGVIS